jgi:hypothetical protein
MVSAPLANLAAVFSRALIAAIAIALVGAMPRGLSVPVTQLFGALLGVGLGAIWLVGWARARRPASSSPPRQWIPIRFSGSLGRFALRRRGDGRHVEIVAAAGQTVAEVVATDEGDEIVLHATVAAAELEHFGAALGQAIEIVIEADEAHLDWDWHAPADEEEHCHHAVA